MNTNKIILYLVEQNIDQRNYDRFGMQIWEKRGFSLEVWELNNKHTTSNPFKNPLIEHYFHIQNLSDAKKKLAKRTNIKICIDLTSPRILSIRICHLLQSSKITLIRCLNAGSIFSFTESYSILKIINRIFKIGLKNLTKIITFKLISKYYLNKINPDFYITSGSFSFPAVIKSSAHQIVPCHSFDYDIYLNLKNFHHESQKKYAVFIDQNLCFHPEYVTANLKPYVTPNLYYPSINAFLRNIMREKSINLVVAAHPRSNYLLKDEASFFPGLEIYHGKTAELISGANFVITHYSTSLSFAILFKKPILFITTNELINSTFSRVWGSVAKELGKDLINIDNPFNIRKVESELMVNRDIYEDFEKKYIKHLPGNEINSWEIVANTVLSSLNYSGATGNINNAPTN